MAEFVIFLIRSIGTSEELGREMGFFAEPIISFAVIFLGNKKCIKNPYLRSKLSEMIFELCPKQQMGDASSTQKLFDLIENHPVARQKLIPSLYQLYVDIEKTGRHGQFYEKLPVRQQISIVLRHLREIPVYFESLKELESNDMNLMRLFTNMMLNDANLTLDELIAKLIEIKGTGLFIP